MNTTTIPTHAISLIEPWATLMAIGAKRVETRSWSTAFRGPVAIHASKKLDKDICRAESYGTVLQKHFGRWDFLGMFPLGAIVGTAELLDCQTVEVISRDLAQITVHGDPEEAIAARNEIFFGDYTSGEGRYGFVCDYAQMLREPIPARGMLNFWRLTDEQRDAIARQMGVAA